MKRLTALFGRSIVMKVKRKEGKKERRKEGKKERSKEGKPHEGVNYGNDRSRWRACIGALR